jgi:hypothetical protein
LGCDSLEELRIVGITMVHVMRLTGAHVVMCAMRVWCGNSLRLCRV